MQNKITTFLLIFFLSVIPVAGIAHPYYVSITEIHIHKQARTFDISCSMFTDDLETAIKKIYLTNTDLQKDLSGKDILDLIYKYANSRLQLNIGGKNCEYNLVGCENIEASTWCYFEGSFTSSPETVTVTNSLLFDYIPEQTNMVHVYLDDQRKSYKLNNPEKAALFVF